MTSVTLHGHDAVNDRVENISCKSKQLSVHDSEGKTLLNSIDATLSAHSGYIDEIETKLASIDTRLDNAMGAGHNNIGEGASKIQVLNYAHDDASGLFRPLRTDTNGRLECSVDALEVTAETINLSTDTLEALIGSTNTKIDTFDVVLDNSLLKLNEIEVSADALISANHTDLIALEASLASMEAKQDTEITHLSEIEGAVETLEACVGSNKVNVNIASGGVTGGSTEAKQDTVIGHIDGIETLIGNNETLLTAISADGDAVQVKLDHLSDNLDTLEASANSIQSAVEGTLTVGSHAVTNAGTFSVQVSSMPTTTVSGTVTATLSGVDNAVLDAIATDGDNIQTLLTQLDVVADANLVKNTNNETLLTAISADGNAIQVQLDHLSDNLDTLETTNNAIQSAVEGTLTVGSHAVTNAGTFSVQVSSMPTTTVSGTVTATLSGTDNAVLDAIATDGDNIQTLLTQLDVVADANLVKNTNNETLLTAISADGDAIQVQLDHLSANLDTLETTNNAIQSAVEGTLTVGSHAVTNAGTFSVQVSSIPTTTVQGTVTCNLSGTDNAVLDAIATDGDNIQTLLTQLDVVADANLVKNTNNETLLTAISADGNAIQVQLDHLSDNLDTLETTNNAIQSAVEGTLTVGSHAVTNAGTFSVQVSSIPTTTVQGTVTCNLSGTDNAVLDAIATDGDNIQTLLTQLDVVADASLVKLGTIDADTGAILTSVDGIEALLSTSVGRTSVNETTARDLATTGSISQYTIDVGTSATFIKFYLDFGLNQPADGDLRVQVSVDNTNWLYERVMSGSSGGEYGFTMTTHGGGDIYIANIQINNPPRYVRLYNANASAVIEVLDGIIEYGRN